MRLPIRPKPTTPSVLPPELHAEARLPAPRAEGAVLLGDAPDGGDDEADRVLGRRLPRAPRLGDEDAARRRRRDVHLAQVPAGQRQEFERRQAPEQRGGEARALADQHQDLVGLEPLRERVFARERVVEDFDAGTAREPLPVGQPEDRALVVVEDRDPLHYSFNHTFMKVLLS